MSRRSRRLRRRVHTLRHLKRRLVRAYERMERAHGSIMNMAWLDAAAEASTCLDALARMGRPVSLKQRIVASGHREVVLTCG